MSKLTVTREHAVDAVDIANDLYNELLSAAGIWRSLMRQKAEGRVGFRQEILDRVVFGHCTIALYKVYEFFTHPIYARVVGEFESESRRAVRLRIEQTELLRLRSSYLGHIHCDKLGRPLRTSEMDAMRVKVCGGDMNAFLLWVADGPDPVMDLVLRIRDHLQKQHAIDPQKEILDR